MAEQVQREVRQFIAADLVRDVDRVGDQDSLLESGILDSLGVMALISFIERRYGVAVSEDEMMPENFDTIEAIATFVAKRRANSDG